MASLLAALQDTLTLNGQHWLVLCCLASFFFALVFDAIRQWKEWQEGSALEGTRVKEVLLFHQLHFVKAGGSEKPALWRRAADFSMNSNFVALLSALILWMNLTAISFSSVEVWGGSSLSKPIEMYGDVMQTTLLEVEFSSPSFSKSAFFHVKFWICVPLVFLTSILLQRPLQARNDIGKGISANAGNPLSISA